MNFSINIQKIDKNFIISICLGIVLYLAIFFNFIISPGTLIYLDHVPWLHPEKYLLVKFNPEFNTWGAITLAALPYILFYLIPFSFLIGVFNATELFWLIAYAISGFYIYKICKELEIPNYYIGIFILLFNPFLYLRITAGQIGMMLSTILSPIYLYYMFKYFNEPTTKNALLLGIGYTISSMFQAHYFLLNGGILLLYSIILAINKKIDLFTFCKAILFITIINIYWLVFLPVLKPIAIKAVTNRHFEFFSPKPSINFNRIAKLVGLYGFWREIAVKRFYKEYPFLFPAILFCLIYLLILGYFSNPKDNKNILFMILFVTGIILAVFIPFLQFIPLAKAFRDSHKFLYYVLLSYTFLIPKSFNEIGKKYKTLLLLAFTLMWTFYNKYLFLLDNQLRPITYPPGYLSADSFLNKVNAKKIIYLPWGVYFSYNWSLKAGLDGRIANPANAIFKKIIITGCNPYTDFCYETPLQRDIRECLDKKSINCLKKLGISYIIVDKSVLVKFNYSWIPSKYLSFKNSYVKIYKI